MAKFDFGAGHPFRGTRFDGFMQLIKASGAEGCVEMRVPKPATDDDLQLVHTPEYVAHVKEVESYEGALSIDTPVPKGMVESAKLIAGAVLDAGTALVKEKYKVAMTFGGFHHAGRANGEGFCVFNDVAIAAEAFLKRHQMKRVLVVDTDAHQGNGTMDVFWNDPRVLFISIHQDPMTIYPGKGFANDLGDGDGRGFTVNIPMPRFSGNTQWAYALEEIFVPLAKEFKPDVIIRNGGSDPFYGDDLTELGLDFDGLAEVGRIVRKTSDDGPGKLLDLMVSGYGNFVTYGWLALFAGTTGCDVDYRKYGKMIAPNPTRVQAAKLDELTGNVVAELKGHLREHWKCFD